MFGLKDNLMKRTLLFLSIFLVVFVQSVTVAQTTTSTDSSNLKVPTAISLLNVNTELEQTQNKLTKISQNVKGLAFKSDFDSLIAVYSHFMENEAYDVNEVKAQTVSKFYLENGLRSWTGYQQRVKDALNDVGNRLATLKKNIDNLKYEKEVWQLTLNNATSTADVPKELKSQIRKMVTQILKSEKDFEAKQKGLILQENKLTDLLITTNDVLDKIQNLKKQMRASLFVPSEPVLWRSSLKRSDVFPVSEHLKRVWNINKRSVRNYFAQQNFLLILLILLLEVVAFTFLRNRYNKLGYDDSKPGFVNANFVFNTKRTSSLLLILLSTILIVLKIIPLSVSALLTIGLLILAIPLVSRFAGSKGSQQSLIVFALFVLNEMEVVFWYFGDLLRYYIIFEGVVGIVLVYYLMAFKFIKKENNNAPYAQKITLISGFIITFFLLSFIADVFGFVNLSTLLTKTAAKIPAILLIVFLLYKLLEIIIIAGCEAGKSFKWHASRYCVNIELNLIRVLKLATVYILIGLILDTLEIYKPVADWIVEALVYNITIGSITISMSRILGMILIIVVSYFLANIFKVLFGNSELVNKSLSKGFLFAINKTVGYIIIIIGFIIGFAYAGIDLGKFSLLAGALGVGIGFGLQNIVNNFISGLILLYERPVEVGDIITVGSLMGEVKSIGVRASKIRTFDGAEVVVPNGNIISNDLINWTLSDKKRRLEIKIGVEYGSNPNEVLKLLQKVAVNNDKVLVDPAPTVLFDGFGESSLDFRLLAWVHFNESLSTKSQLSIAVYDALSEANIGIPFPQIDLHIKEHLTEQPKVVTPKAPDNTPEVVNDVIEEDDE